MKQVITEGLLKKYLVYTIATGRLLTLLIVLMLKFYGKLLETDFYKLVYCLMPITTLYGVFLIKYIYVNKKYIHPGNTMSKSYFIIRFAPLLIIVLAELALIIFNQQIFVNSIEPLFWTLLPVECLLAAYSGFYITGLFARQASS